MLEDSEIQGKKPKMMASLFLECQPITSVEQLQTVIHKPPLWTQRIEPLQKRSLTVVQNVLADCHIEYNLYLPRQRYDRRLVPKTLICHDYKGGYQDDRFLHFPNENIVGNGYTFYNWAQIDIFVYFSHHFITIPPLSWINVAHNNGVKILGTLIMESDSGTKICEQIFKNMETMEKFSSDLVTLTKMFNLDGWLLNIENPIEAKLLPVFKSFVGYFTNCIHLENAENSVIWYDSVTENGLLQWQNQLNKQNRYFFDACDGIYLNYAWTEQSLLNTIVAAKHRNSDVFVGVDVFGRNTFGGGMFNCYKAAEIIRKYNLSMAIFAPGWTHETISKNVNFFEQFLNKDSAFWSSLLPYLYTHPITNYFKTTFYIGLDKSFYNLFNQQQQLSRISHPANTSVVPKLDDVLSLKFKCNCIQSVTITEKNALLLTRAHLPENQCFVHHLFVCDLEVTGNFIVYFFTKNLEGDSATKLSATLLTCNDNGCFRKITLLSNPVDIAINNCSDLEVNPSFDEKMIDNLNRELGYDSKVDKEKYKLSIYKVSTDSGKILEVGVTVGDGDSIYLCAFGIREDLGGILSRIQ